MFVITYNGIDMFMETHSQGNHFTGQIIVTLDFSFIAKKL